jgi:ABC-2 type transport system ATP-binding protein
MEFMIEARNLVKSFGDLNAVDQIQLQVAGGQIYGLVGPDGAGKTTTLRLLCGALLPDRSQPVKPLILIGGIDILKQTEQARSQIGYLPQRFSLYEDLTVLENIRFFAEVRGLSPSDWRPRSLEILDFVGLEEFAHRRAGQLSGGMKQKLGLAAALVHKPHVLLLDEPTTGVDPVTRQDFWQLIIQLVSEVGQDGLRTSVLVSTPYMDEAARCHRVGFMQRGKMVVEGTPAELRARLEGRVLELAGKPMFLLRKLLESEAGIQDLQMFGDRIHLRVAAGDAGKVMAHLQALIPARGGQIDRLRPIPAQLEDVFMELLEAGR